MVEDHLDSRSDLIRMSSGVPGLDELIDGGFPFPSVILVSGSAGTGKTTFCLEYLCEGARKGEQCLYITTLSEPTQWMLRYASQFDFISTEFFGREIEYMDLGDRIRTMSAQDLLDAIDMRIAEVMPQRIVIDPITVVGDMLKGDYRTFLFDLTNRLKNWNATTIVTGEVSPGELYPPEVSYASDGIVLLLMREDMDARRKYLEVLKMRGTNHVTGKHSIDISRATGITVLQARF